MVDNLVAAGVDLHMPAANGRSPLHTAAWEAHGATLTAMIKADRRRLVGSDAQLRVGRRCLFPGSQGHR